MSNSLTGEFGALFEYTERQMKVETTVFSKFPRDWVTYRLRWWNDDYTTDAIGPKSTRSSPENTSNPERRVEGPFPVLNLTALALTGPDIVILPL